MRRKHGARFLRVNPRTFEIHGHRGARGLAPENSLPAFARALAIGVDALEMDLGLSADDEVVVVHDRHLPPHLCRDMAGRWIGRGDIAVRSLTLAELQSHDIGRIDPRSDYAKKFPQQTPCDGARIPTLAEVAALATAGEVRFNLEIKFSPTDATATAAPDFFARRVVDEVRRLGLARRTMIQCFYWPILRVVREAAAEIQTGYLSGRAGGEDLRRWTEMDPAQFDHRPAAMARHCAGDAWLPDHRGLSRGAVQHAHALGLRVLPWTVNEVCDMQRLVRWRVDGIISDYPDRLRRVAEDLGAR